MAKTQIKPASCPCGKELSLAQCCGRFIDGLALAETAEQLMRSRYTAYALGNAAYLTASWHASTRPETLDLETSIKWIRLKVLDHNTEDDTHARVTFDAHYKLNGRACKLHETSRFVREDGQWFYLDGN